MADNLCFDGLIKTLNERYPEQHAAEWQPLTIAELGLLGADASLQIDLSRFIALGYCEEEIVLGFFWMLVEGSHYQSQFSRHLQSLIRMTVTRQKISVTLRGVLFHMLC